MCFQNDISGLNEYRAKKRAITVWKYGLADEKTGRVSTHWDGDQDRVWWIKGTVVKPTRIRSPLGRRSICSVGLYFHTRKIDVPLRTGGSFRVRKLITARVKPEDIIAVSDTAFNGGRQICCVAAKVIDAPDPDQRTMRLKWLNQHITKAREERREREATGKFWLEEQAEKTECLQRMIAEANGLRTALKGSKRASKSG